MEAIMVCLATITLLQSPISPDNKLISGNIMPRLVLIPRERSLLANNQLGDDGIRRRCLGLSQYVHQIQQELILLQVVGPLEYY